MVWVESALLIELGYSERLVWSATKFMRRQRVDITTICAVVECSTLSLST